MTICSGGGCEVEGKDELEAEGTGCSETRGRFLRWQRDVPDDPNEAPNDSSANAEALR